MQPISEFASSSLEANLQKNIGAVNRLDVEQLIVVDPNFSIMVLKFKKWIFLKLCLFLDP